MGRSILCPHCNSVLNEDILKKRNSENVCLACGESLLSVSDGENSTYEENEELDFEHPDLYYYDIEREDEYEDSDLRDIWCNCTSCRESNRISYNKFDYISEDYVKLKKDLDLKCKGCGKPFTNIIVPKRPENWQRLAMWEKDYKNLPKCPTCSSINIKKISVTSKAASVAMWGLLSRKVHKQWHCNVCGSEW